MPVDSRARMHHVEHVTECVDRPRLAALATGERLVELQLESRKAAVVEACVAEDVRRDRALRIETPFLGIEAEPGKVELLEAIRLGGIGLARDVDEARFPIRQLIEKRVRVDAEDAPGGGGDRTRIADLPRVGIDRRRLLADRELHSRPVEDRPARRGQDDDRAVLLRRKARQRSGLAVVSGWG